MKNTTNNKIIVPTVKSQLPIDAWLRKVNMKGYNRRVNRLGKLFQGLNPSMQKLSKAQKDIAHYFLDVMTVDETRRNRFKERNIDDVIEENILPKNSLRY